MSENNNYAQSAKLFFIIFSWSLGRPKPLWRIYHFLYGHSFYPKGVYFYITFGRNEERSWPVGFFFRQRTRLFKSTDRTEVMTFCHFVITVIIISLFNGAAILRNKLGQGEFVFAVWKQRWDPPIYIILYSPQYCSCF